MEGVRAKCTFGGRPQYFDLLPGTDAQRSVCVGCHLRLEVWGHETDGVRSLEWHGSLLQVGVDPDHEDPQPSLRNASGAWPKKRLANRGNHLTASLGRSMYATLGSRAIVANIPRPMSTDPAKPARRFRPDRINLLQAVVCLRAAVCVRKCDADVAGQKRRDQTGPAHNPRHREAKVSMAVRPVDGGPLLPGNDHRAPLSWS